MNFFKRHPWLCSTLTLVAVLSFVAVGIFQSVTQPTVRENVNAPVFTIGDPAYANGMNNGANVLKFGPLPCRLYSGGLAFSTVTAAQEYLASLGEKHGGRWPAGYGIAVVAASNEGQNRIRQTQVLPGVAA